MGYPPQVRKDSDTSEWLILLCLSTEGGIFILDGYLLKDNIGMGSTE